MGTLIWVEVERNSNLTAVFRPETVLGIVHGVVLEGARVVAVAGRDLSIGEIVLEGGRQMFFSAGSGMKEVTAAEILGSIAVVIEPCAARAMTVRGKRRRRR